MKIIDELKEKRKPFKEINAFSDQPGIYAIFFHGKKFPFEGHQPAPDEIIYLGKTESSQKNRDANTHFASGKTGSSTLRRSFGSMLRDELSLNPIPRSHADVVAARTSHFKFDELSEDRLTDWMQHNLSMSFHEFIGSKNDLDQLETLLIKEAIPILNIDFKNPKNPYLIGIRQLRKACGQMAYQNQGTGIKAKKPPKTNNKTYVNAGLTAHKYKDIWQHLRPGIIEKLQKKESHVFPLKPELFKSVGNRKNYTFRIVYERRNPTNNLRGSAVARDLDGILRQNEAFMRLPIDYFIIRMDKEFNLHVIV